MYKKIKNPFANKPAVLILLITAIAMLAAALTACSPANPGPTPTPTRTPRPTLTPTLAPTPTPAFPITVGCDPNAPAGACTRLNTLVEADPGHFAWIDDVALADVALRTQSSSEEASTGTWTYVVAAPFFTVEDDITFSELRDAWTHTTTDTTTIRPLVVTTDTQRTLLTLFGPPTNAQIQITNADDLLAAAEQTNGWAILPFDELTTEWKVLRIDGISPLEKSAAMGNYPLTLPLTLDSAARPDALDLLPLTDATLTNRNEEAMTIVAMTGVTAMTRGTGLLMDAKGVTYPAQDIKHWFDDADFVHISNEVSFKPDCVAEGSGTMSFCSNDSYIALLEEINTNIVELTGNHLADKGSEWITHSLEMYQARGWQWFGGGADLADATRPLKIEQGPNHIAFLGCNPIGPSYDLATETSPGSAPCDYEAMKTQIRQLREEGYLPIVTLQYLETYEYFPTPNQLYDFREFAKAGAVMVQGSQAHQAQTLELYGDTFIHYGLGNFFFDQMWSTGTRQEFVDRLTFYEGQLLSIDLRTALLEEYGRPRPMTPEERQQFLQMIFELSPQND